MKRKIRQFLSLFLLLVFLVPSIVKIEHHHKDPVCKTENGEYYRIFHEKCAICEFKFFTFFSPFEHPDLQDESPSDYYSNNYSFSYFPHPSQFSFSLRGPPLSRI